LLIIGPAQEYVEDQWQVIMPIIGVPTSVRALAIEAGAVLMLLIAARRVLASSSVGEITTLIGAAAAIAACFWWAQPALLAGGNFNLLVFFFGLLGACIAVGVPIAFGFGIATLAYLACTTSVPLSVMVN